jgi:sorting nexin-8
MSLFGEFPDDPPAARSKSSLFNDDRPPTHGRSTSNLFADDDLGDSSPWGMPTPKKAGRAQLIKTLLPAGDVPELYVDVFDKLEERTVEGVLREAGISGEARERIEGIFEGAIGKELGRGEVNVLLALVGLSQEGEEVSLDGVDERRRSMIFLLKLIEECANNL